MARKRERHGMAGKPIYRSWQAMKSRCYRVTDECYPIYSAKGITVCPEWKDSFVQFYKDMGNPPEGDGRNTIERLDNTKGYYPENCVWATDKTQARNRGMRSDNTSGVTGVYLLKYNGVPSYWLASVIDANGETLRDIYSIKEYGNTEAFNKAVASRQRMLEDVNSSAEYKYTDTHGKNINKKESQ